MVTQLNVVSDDKTHNLITPGNFESINFSPDNMTLNLTGDIDVLDEFKGTYRIHGKSLRQVLNEICSRRRGLAWRPETLSNDVDDEVYISVHSQLSVPVALSAQTVISENLIQHEMENDSIIKNVSIQKSYNNKYDNIQVRGGNVRAVFSLSFNNSTLAEGWDAADETTYKALATTWTTNPRIDIPETLRRVYTTFRVKTDWNLKAGDGTSSPGTVNFVTPTVNPDGSLDTATEGARVRGGKTFLRFLPLLRNNDYTSATPTTSRFDRWRDVPLYELRREWVGKTIRTAPRDSQPLSNLKSTRGSTPRFKQR